MAEYTKPSDLNKRWASSATPPDITTPGDVKISAGNAVEKPAYDYFNWWMGRVDTFNAFMNQHGYPTWDASTEYIQNKSYVMHSDGVIYKCILTHTNQTIPNATYWRIAFGDYGYSYSKAESDNLYLAKANNLSDLSNVNTARTNMGVYSTSQTDTVIAAAINQYMIVRDEKAYGTTGGNAVNGVQTRTLNTVLKNTISGASLASNRITLPAGSYRILAFVPGTRTDQHKAYIYNYTSSTYLLVGTNCNATDSTESDFVVTNSVIMGEIVLASTSAIEVRQYFNSPGTGSLGNQTSDSISSVEVYTTIEIVKVA